MQASTHRSVVVVGGGIVGMATALRLQADGLTVTLFDPRRPGTGCSEGNSGGLGIGLVAPIAMPGIVLQAPRLLLDPDEPLFINPRIFPRAFSWFWGFARSSRPSRVATIAAARAALNKRVMTTLAPLLDLANAGSLVRHQGMNFLFRGDRPPAGAVTRIELGRRHGIEAVPLSRDELAGLYPGISADVGAGIRIPGNRHCTDPLALVTAFADAFRVRGGRIVSRPVTALLSDGTGVIVDGSTHRCDEVVVAAGAWSRDLVAPLGYRVPLEAERGYHLMLPQAGVRLPAPTTLADRNIVMTPMDHGLRITGIAEFAPLDAPPQFAHAHRLLRQARRFFPGLQSEGATPWMGPRPSTPDSLPVIGQAPGRPHLWFAFGHGQSGLAHASVTADLIAVSLSGRATDVTLAPYRIERFGCNL